MLDNATIKVLRQEVAKISDNATIKVLRHPLKKYRLGMVIIDTRALLSGHRIAFLLRSLGYVVGERGNGTIVATDRFRTGTAAEIREQVRGDLQQIDEDFCNFPGWEEDTSE